MSLLDIWYLKCVLIILVREGDREREGAITKQKTSRSEKLVSHLSQHCVWLCSFFFGLENNKTVKRGLELATKEIIDCVEEETIKKYGKNNFCL